MTASTTLRVALQQAAAELERIEPPVDLRARVRDALAARAVPQVSAAPKAWAWGGAMACATVLIGSAVLMLRQPAADLPADATRAGDFVPLVPAERWPRESSQAWLVSTEMPRERLAALGLPFDPARAGDSVHAELLVRASGEVLAVRFAR